MKGHLLVPEGVVTVWIKRTKTATFLLPSAKRAEYRLAEAYGELPKGMTSKKASEEEVQEKMKPYLWMYKKPLTPTAVQAIRALVEINV